jgi:hypothetical protein
MVEVERGEAGQAQHMVGYEGGYVKDEEEEDAVAGGRRERLSGWGGV